MYPNKTALILDKVKYSYCNLYKLTLNLASNLAHIYDLQHGDRVAMIARNSIESAVALFALSRVGVNVYLLNPEMSDSQFKSLFEQRSFKFIVYDNDQLNRIYKHIKTKQSIAISGSKNESIESLSKCKAVKRINKRKGGNIIVLTGGTTGNFKSASRKQSISNFLNPLVALIEEIQLHLFKSVYIPTPIYHGYGLATLIVAVLLGKEIYFTRRFKGKEACELIEKHQIEVVTLVPVMLKRILNEKPSSLKSLKRILSGGATLDHRLITSSFQTLGPILYNLYGTTEVGFCILGTPLNLSSNPTTVGKPIKGVKVRIESGKRPGVLEIKCDWAMKSAKNKWISTGDLATIDSTGIITLKGRTDDMIISGGENVYPKDLENILSLHEQIDMVAVTGTKDPEFGQRLKAFVSMKPYEETNQDQLKEWLRPRIARYQMPVAIEFLEELPLTSIGKVNKKMLK